jgi:hypothetical protein
MKSPPAVEADRTWTLPPLILHPFSDVHSPQKLVQSSRANLILQGLLPANEESLERLHEILMEGRFCEIRMLFYVGKDTTRWIEQCLDLVDREPGLRSSGFNWQSFASLLVEDPPAAVVAKLKSWGVADHRAIFSRGLGLTCVFGDAPPLRDTLSDHFVRNHHQYADQMFMCRLNESTFARLRPDEFLFDLFASGEYTNMLEREWASQEPPI